MTVNHLLCAVFEYKNFKCIKVSKLFLNFRNSKSMHMTYDS